MYGAATQRPRRRGGDCSGCQAFCIAEEFVPLHSRSAVHRVGSSGPANMVLWPQGQKKAGSSGGGGSGGAQPRACCAPARLQTHWRHSPTGINRSGGASTLSRVTMMGCRSLCAISAAIGVLEGDRSPLVAATTAEFLL